MMLNKEICVSCVNKQVEDQDGYPYRHKPWNTQHEELWQKGTVDCWLTDCPYELEQEKAGDTEIFRETKHSEGRK